MARNVEICKGCSQFLKAGRKLMSTHVHDGFSCNCDSWSYTMSKVIYEGQDIPYDCEMELEQSVMGQDDDAAVFERLIKEQTIEPDDTVEDVPEMSTSEEANSI